MNQMVKLLFPRVFRLRFVLAGIIVVSVFYVSNISFTDESKDLVSMEYDFEDLISLHDKNSTNYSKNCTNSNCHADILNEESLDPEFPTAHEIMLNSTPGRNDTRCRWCHTTVDLLQKSTGNLRRHVDVFLCAVCHGPTHEDMKYYQAEPTDGAQLYEMVCSTCHGALSNSNVRGEPASEIWEGIYENEGRMGPLDALTNRQVSAIANALRCDGGGRNCGGSGGGGGDDDDDDDDD